MKKVMTCLVLAASFMLTPKQSIAVEVLTTAELALHCDSYPNLSESADGQYCIRYIQGFIDGAVATDVRVMINIEAEANKEESFTERAFRTRMPSRSDSRRAAKYAEFCLGDPVPLKEVVSKVVRTLNADRESNGEGPARNVVYQALRTHYPCSEDE